MLEQMSVYLKYRYELRAIYRDESDVEEDALQIREKLGQYWEDRRLRSLGVLGDGGHA